MQAIQTFKHSKTTSRRDIGIVKAYKNIYYISPQNAVKCSWKTLVFSSFLKIVSDSAAFKRSKESSNIMKLSHTD